MVCIFLILFVGDRIELVLFIIGIIVVEVEIDLLIVVLGEEVDVLDLEDVEELDFVDEVEVEVLVDVMLDPFGMVEV